MSVNSITLALSGLEPFLKALVPFEKSVEKGAVVYDLLVMSFNLRYVLFRGRFYELCACVIIIVNEVNDRFYFIGLARLLIGSLSQFF